MDARPAAKPAGDHPAEPTEAPLKVDRGGAPRDLHAAWDHRSILRLAMPRVTTGLEGDRFHQDRRGPGDHHLEGGHIGVSRRYLGSARRGGADRWSRVATALVVACCSRQAARWSAVASALVEEPAAGGRS
jgi:hypothetical protein